MSPHAFVDESKAPGYIVVAVMVPTNGVVAARRAVRDLLLGQRRIHFSYESTARKLKILDAMGQLDQRVLYQEIHNAGVAGSWSITC